MNFEQALGFCLQSVIASSGRRYDRLKLRTNTIALKPPREIAPSSVPLYLVRWDCKDGNLASSN